MARKLIIQIPCLNEEDSIGITLDALPRKIAGIDEIETLIINDGSTDATSEVARNHGATHVIELSKNQGLAKAFMTGLVECLARGADIIVNTDADNQYRGSDVEKLIRPILEGKAEFVIGSRPIATNPNFSWCKKVLQRLGSKIVRMASQSSIPDAPSGFRAFTREAAMQLNVFSDFSYTLETIIQAGQKDMAIAHVPVEVNEVTRPSRLFNRQWGYIFKSMITIIRIFMTYQPFRFFAIPGVISILAGTLLLSRFLYFYFTVVPSGHTESLVFASMCLGIGFFLVMVGLITDLISVNRKLLEKISWQQFKLEELIHQEGQAEASRKKRLTLVPKKRHEH